MILAILLIILIINILVLISILIKFINLKIKHRKLEKYLLNYLNAITSARYGNLNVKISNNIDALTIQLSKNTNALFESIVDRDKMINEYIEKEHQHQNIKQDFISSLTHDLKVPIIAQDNTYDLFLNGSFGELSLNQKEVINNLKISNNDLKNLVINLLDVQKLDIEDYKLDIQKTDLVEFIKSIIEQNQSILKIKNKKINFKSNKDEIIYPIDSFLIKRLMNNLISNAVFYGKNSPNIDISIDQNKDNIGISVIDYGEGINEEDVNNLFKKYYSTSKKYSNIGVGLGLYIANKIALAHGAKIVAQNNAEKGANFTLILPR